ncbi:MAG: LPS export ABC transporter periplasmic protein LptC [Alsobacter sp.]
MAVGMARMEAQEMAQGLAQARYAEAMRHSSRVRWLRRMIPVGALAVMGGVVFWAWYEPFKDLPAGVSVGAVSINGTKVTMELPKLSGFKKDNRPYQVTARWAEQDLKNPSIIGLREVKAKIALQDRSMADVEALNGSYNSQNETMSLKDDVRVRTETGYDVRMRSADIEFKAGNVRTPDPVSVRFTGGTIDADSLEMFDNGQKVVFSGRVRTVMRMAAEPKPAKPAAASAQPSPSQPSPSQPSPSKDPSP